MRRSVKAIAAAALLAAASACSKPAEPAAAPAPEAAAPASNPGAELSANDPARAAIQAAVEARLGAELGVPAKMNVEIMRADGDWAYASGPAVDPAGGEIDFTKTKLAPAATEGMMDGSNTIALLKKVDGAWTVVEFAVGPTDVPQVGWPAKHGVAPALVGQEG